MLIEDSFIIFSLTTPKYTIINEKEVTGLLTDLAIQFFDTQPRRERAVFGLLAGKKTISNLYAALTHQQLQWLQLYPSLSKELFLQAVAQLKMHGQLTTCLLYTSDAADE